MLRALTSYQPWPAAMALGLKVIETRARRCNHRGELAIHSAMWADGDAMIALERLHRNWPRWALVRGAILCVVELYDCIGVDELARRRTPLSAVERMLGDYAPGRYALLTRNLRILKEPVPCKGRQGLWTVPPEVEVQVRAQLGRSREV